MADGACVLCRVSALGAHWRVAGAGALAVRSQTDESAPHAGALRGKVLSAYEEFETNTNYKSLTRYLCRIHSQWLGESTGFGVPHSGETQPGIKSMCAVFDR